MSDRRQSRGGETEPSAAAPSVWWLVLKQELIELWLGQRVLNLLILFSVLMSITALLVATNNEVQLLPLSETVLVALTAAITFGLFNGLIISAESITGERERATLEALLLTPASRQHIILGKFLAALSLWPVTLLLSIPYIAVLSRSEPVLGQALFWGAIVGSLLAVAFTGFGMLLSMWSSSSRISLAVSLLAYVFALVPAQLPSEFQVTPLGVLVATTNPLEASRQFLKRTLVESQPLGEVWFYLAAPIIFIALLLGVLLLYAAPRLSLEGGRAGMNWRIWRPAEEIK